MELKQRLFATREYLESRGAPRTLDELRGHDLLAWLPPGETDAPLHARDGKRVPWKPAFTTSDVHLLHECALVGNAIAWAPDALLPAAPGRPPFVTVLEREVGREIPLKLAVPCALADVPKMRVFIDNLAMMRGLVASAS